MFASKYSFELGSNLKKRLRKEGTWTMKALDEIYKIYMLLHRSDLNISAIFRQFFGVFKIRNDKKFDFFKFRHDFC